MEFKPRRSIRNRRIAAALIGAFMIFSISVFFFADKTFGIVSAVVSVIMLLIILPETGRLGWYYSVDNDGIRIKRTFKRYFIALDNISSVKEIGRKQVYKIVAEVQNRKDSSKVNSGFSAQIELGRLIGYSSVHIIISKKRTNNQHNITGKNRFRGENFVLLRKKDGKRYILSPADAKGFLKECADKKNGK